MMPIHVVPVTWDERREDMCRIRHAVFVVEQGVPEELEWDEADASSEHFIALDSAGRLLGCARLTADGQIGRMAVTAEQRGQGIGAELLQAAVARAREKQLTQVTLHAQSHAEGFYRKAGFLAVGEPYLEAGISHISMEMALPIAFAPPSVDDATVRKAQDGPAAAAQQQPSVPPISFDDETEALAALQQCLQSPRRRLSVLSPLLDPALFDQAEVADALSKFVRSGSTTQLRILIYSSKLIVSRGHLLLALARRLDDKILIRRVPEEYARDERSFAVWDQQGYWLLPNSSAYQGLATGTDAVMAARLQERFDYLWEKSQPDPELRTLKL